jgi:outer membrane lipoprotein SlyB
MKTRKNLCLWLAALAVAATGFVGCSKNTGTEETSTAKSDTEKAGGILSRSQPVTLAAGTPIPVILDQSLSSNGSSAGETFEATVLGPIVADGKTVIPDHARARGRVIAAQPSGRLQTPAHLSFALTAVEIGGAWHEISTSAVSLSGKSHKTRDIEIIGGGSALGAIVGAIAGHGKGAAIGAAAGAGAGTVGAAATGKKDITVPAESHVEFRLRQPLTVEVR